MAGRASRRRRGLTLAASVALHGVVLWSLLATWSATPQPAELAAMDVTLVPPAPPSPRLDPQTEPEEQKAEVPPPKTLGRPARAPVRDVVPIPVKPGPATISPVEVSDALAAGAATADSGAGGGRSCNMARWLQDALRKDAQVQAAVMEIQRGKALMVWDGDWVRYGGQEGAGLAAVREAIQWRVAFAPVACRAEPVRGLVVLSLNDGPGAARLAMGAPVGGGDWRWQDLLFSKAAKP